MPERIVKEKSFLWLFVVLLCGHDLSATANDIVLGTFTLCQIAAKFKLYWSAVPTLRARPQSGNQREVTATDRAPGQLDFLSHSALHQLMSKRIGIVFRSQFAGSYNSSFLLLLKNYNKGKFRKKNDPDPVKLLKSLNMDFSP